jgi:nucleoside-diphosphate-sugar epimerase
MASIPFELKGKTVYVAGHRGMVGAALVRRLAAENVELLTATRNEVELRDQAAVNNWFAAKRPQVVFCIHLMKAYSGDELINIGTDEDITSAEFGRVVAATVGYAGGISFDASRPDGPPRKLLDGSRAGQTRLARQHRAGGRHQARLCGLSRRDEWPLN